MRPVDLPLAGPLLDQERTGIVLHDLDGNAVAEAAHPGAVCKRDRDGARDLRVEAASQHYFGVSARGLTLEQSAMLAAVLPNPKGWDPTNPGRMLRWRQQRILRRERNANFPEKLLRNPK